MSAVVWAAALLVLLPVGFNVAFAMLASSFDYPDVLRRPITVLTSDQGPALGSAIHAAVAAGAYPDIRAASEAMGKVERAAYTPDPL